MQICPQDLQQQVETLNTELGELKSRETQESNSDLSAKLQELHAQYVSLLSCVFYIYIHLCVYMCVCMHACINV